MSTDRQKPGHLLWIVPLATVAFSVGGFNLAAVWQAADLNLDYLNLIKFVSLAVPVLGALFLPVWFFGFTRVSRPTKAVVLVAGMLLLGVAAACIDGFTLDADLRPIPHFRWQPRAAPQATTTDGLPPIDLTVDPVNDFPRYRGLLGDGVVRPSELLDVRWETGKPVELWRHPCGGGFAGFAVAGNVLVTVEQRGPQEAVVCYDRATGKQRWLYGYDESFTHATGSGPRATPTIADGEVYSLGALGDLVCLDGATGDLKWRVNILTDNEAKCVTWGMTSSPLVVDDLVIVNPGVDAAKNAGRGLAAYQRKDGKRLWGAGKHKAGYSSAHLANLAGRKQVLIYDAGGLTGHDVQTGAELWHYPWESYQDMNIVQPVLCDDDRVFISSEPSNGCAMLKVTRKGTEFDVQPVWANKDLGAKQANPVRVGNALYGLHAGILVCLNLADGRRLWRGPNFGQGQMLALAGTLLVQSERGELVLVVADRERYRELDRIKVFTGPRTWNTPALAGRYLYLRNDEQMVCYELPLKQ